MPRAETIERWMNEAIALFAEELNPQLAQCTTHQVLIVSGWDRSPRQIQAIGRYLVGLRLCAINSVLKIRAEVTETDEDGDEILQNVRKIVGEDANLQTAEQKERGQYPWIAEGIWHLCFASAFTLHAMHPPGRLLTLSLPHPSSNDHGFDLAAIYETGGNLGLSLVETKAYPENPTLAINLAAKFYREIDNGAGTTSLRLRQAVAQMRAELPQQQQDKVSLTLWKQHRCYLPNPHCDAQHVLQWRRTRDTLRGLAPGPLGVVIMPHIVEGFVTYFEQIAQAMRDAAEEL